MSTVQIALIVFGVALIAGLALAGWQGLGAWKAFKGFRRRVLPAIEETTAKAAAIEAKMAGLAEKTARLEQAQRRLQDSLAEAQVLATGWSEVAGHLRNLHLIVPTR